MRKGARVDDGQADGLVAVQPERDAVDEPWHPPRRTCDTFVAAMSRAHEEQSSLRKKVLTLRQIDLRAHSAHSLVSCRRAGMLP